MKKYIQIFQINVLQYFVYRLSFILWRVRNVMMLIFLYFLWTNVFTYRTTIFSYNKSQLITYILLINVLSSIVLSTRTSDIAGEILSGDIINYLIKPFSFFRLTIIKEFTDKLINFIFSVTEIILLLIIFQPKIFIQSNIFAYLMFFISIVIGIIISFCISLMISLVAFWSNETWAPRFIYFVLISMIAGALFPLEILPKSLYNFLLLTPFPYLIYLPAKIYIHGFSFSQTVPFIISLFWLFVLYKMMVYIWQKGIKNYTFYGK